MSIRNYISNDKIILKALTKNPGHVVAAVFKTVADLIMKLDPDFDRCLAVKNGTEASVQFIRILGTEKVAELKSLLKRAVSDPEFNYAPTDILKSRAHADASYFVVVSQPPAPPADGTLVPASSSTAFLTSNSLSAPPGTKSASKSTPYKLSNPAPTLSLADPMKEWLKAQLQGLAKESQINELSIKVTNFENTIKNVESLTSKVAILESIVPTRKEVLLESKKVTDELSEFTKNECLKVQVGVDANSLETRVNREDIAEINNKMKTLEDFGSAATLNGTPAMSKAALLAKANYFVCGVKLYWRAINFAKRSGIFTMIIKDPNLYKEIAVPEDAEDGAKSTFELHFSRIHRVIGVKVSAVKDFNIRTSLTGNLVTKCRIQGITPADTFNKLKKLIDTKHEPAKTKYVHICLITPDEFDISDVLNLWVDELKCAIKFDVTKSGGVTVMINDGSTSAASGSIPAIEAVKQDQAYLKTCSRLNISNPHETAKLNNPTIVNLRRLASGKWFVADGVMTEFPATFKRVPRNPGFVNDTYDREFNGEFSVEEDDDDSWSASDVEDN